MPRNSRRNEWKRTKSGGWTRSLGERGMRVRLFQNRRGGVFQRTIWIPGHGRDTRSLGTRDRSDAERLGRELLAALLTGDFGPRPGVVTLGRLWERYQAECPGYLACTATTKKDAVARATVLRGHFGDDVDVSTLTEHDVRQFIAARRAGGIVTRTGQTTRPARARTADADLVLLNTMLRWATTVREPNGERWLKDNPLQGIRRPREPNPKRPVATWERFTKTRAAMRELAEAAPGEAERVRWMKMELALVLAEATGRRLSSIRHLRWEDIDLDRRTIRWRAEHDKKGREWVIPIPAGLLEELRQFRTAFGAIAGWVFGRESDGAAPMDRHLFDKWLVVAERHAKLPKLEGGLWHPYRRKWATERKHLPLSDVAEAGGWKDRETLLECYQQPDPDTLLRVMESGRKLREPDRDPEKRHPERNPHVG